MGFFIPNFLHLRIGQEQHKRRVFFCYPGCLVQRIIQDPSFGSGMGMVLHCSACLAVHAQLVACCAVAKLLAKGVSWNFARKDSFSYVTHSPFDCQFRGGAAHSTSHNAQKKGPSEKMVWWWIGLEGLELSRPTYTCATTLDLCIGPSNQCAVLLWYLRVYA